MPNIQHVPICCPFCDLWALQRITHIETSIEIHCTACMATNPMKKAKKEIPQFITNARQFYTEQLFAHPQLRQLRAPGDSIALPKGDVSLVTDDQ